MKKDKKRLKKKKKRRKKIKQNKVILNSEIRKCRIRRWVVGSMYKFCNLNMIKKEIKNNK